MKKILFLSFLACVFIVKIQAQGTANLVFSRVLLVTSVQSVPSGYAWKIENVLPSTRLSSAAAEIGASDGVIQTSTLSTEQIIKINENNIYFATSDSKSIGFRDWNGSTYPHSGYSANATTSNSNSISGPIWLPEGTSLEASTGVFAISVLEFKVIPY